MQTQHQQQPHIQNRVWVLVNFHSSPSTHFREIVDGILNLRCHVRNRVDTRNRVGTLVRTDITVHTSYNIDTRNNSLPDVLAERLV